MTMPPDTPQRPPFTAPLASALCLAGFFLHILLSDPLLRMMGMHYSGDSGAFYEKIHPGTWCVFAGFMTLLLRQGNPLRQIFLCARDQPAATALLAVSVTMFVYVVLRSGMAGSAFLLDTHWTVPMGALVLGYTSASMCRWAVLGFLTIALANAGIGIVEAIHQTRLFTFDADWKVLHETYFRASALRGHPLNNAMFTSVAMFVLLGARLNRSLMLVGTTVFLVALVAFGGRVALGYALLALFFYGAATLWQWMRSRVLTPSQWLAVILLTIGVPLVVAVGMYGVLESSIGTRILAHGWWDKSAYSRQLAPLVFDYLKPDEFWLGMAVPKLVALVARMNQVVPIDDIENPWLLMLLVLGASVFPFWLAATGWFACSLMRAAPLVNRLAVLAYYITASTSNSFGRKDSTYFIMVVAVLCLARTQLYFASARRKE